MDRAKLAPTSTVRGWETLPVRHPVSGRRRRRRRAGGTTARCASERAAETRERIIAAGCELLQDVVDPGLGRR